MTRKLLGVLGVAGLLAALAGPAVAQAEAQKKDECCDWVWKTDGKRWSRTLGCKEPFKMPETMRIEVAPGDQKEGDILGFKYVGKRMERVYFRDVPRPEPAVAKGHECSWRLHYVGKRTTREHFCIVDGVEKPCPGMTEAGECVAKK